ncbi:MAG: hypothetical protein ACO1OB_05845 [Archangium sp.]
MKTALISMGVVVALSGCSGKKAKEAYQSFVSTRADVENRLPAETDLMTEIASAGDAGTNLLQRAQLLSQKAVALRAREETVSRKAAVALADTDCDEIRVATAELQAIGTEADVVRKDIAALKQDLHATMQAPDTTTLTELAMNSGAHLERVFARSGWVRPPGSSHGVMKASGYTYENFELGKGGMVMTVFIVRPCADCSGTAGVSPAQSAEAAKLQNKVFLFDEKANVYVELMPKTDATDADARSLLEAVVKKD